MQMKEKMTLIQILDLSRIEKSQQRVSCVNLYRIVVPPFNAFWSSDGKGTTRLGDV